MISYENHSIGHSVKLSLFSLESYEELNIETDKVQCAHYDNIETNGDLHMDESTNDPIPFERHSCGSMEIGE